MRSYIGRRGAAQTPHRLRPALLAGSSARLRATAAAKWSLGEVDLPRTVDNAARIFGVVYVSQARNSAKPVTDSDVMSAFARATDAERVAVVRAYASVVMAALDNITAPASPEAQPMPPRTNGRGNGAAHGHTTAHAAILA